MNPQAWLIIKYTQIIIQIYYKAFMYIRTNMM